MTRLLAGLLPREVRVAESFGEPAHTELHPAEEPAVARAHERRRREFAATRACARAALAELGIAPGPVPADLGAAEPWARRAPLWPDGVVGSLTHCEGYRGAAVAPAAMVASLGVDAEPHGPLPDGVLDRVTLDDERAMLAALERERAGVPWDRVLFSAKESVFKAWFALAARWLGFEECRMTVRADGVLRARLLVRGPVVDGRHVEEFDGAWVVTPQHVGTAIVVPRGPQAAVPGSV